MLSIEDHAPWPPCPAPFNLAAHVLLRAGTPDDKVALQVLRLTGAERWNHARLLAAVRGCGTGLLAQGLVPGDRVLMRLANTVEFPVVFLGAIAAGLVPVPTSASLTAAEITRMAALVAPSLTVAAEGVSLPDDPGPVLPADRIAAMADLAPCAWDMGDPDRLAYVVFTSGTSGRAQAVAHAHRAIWARGMMHQGWEGLGPFDRLLHAGAFNWTYTLGTGLLDPWTVGATALIPGPGVTPADLPLLMKRFDATIFAAAPGIYRQMLHAGLPPLPRLRHGLSAGEAMAPAVRAAWTAATGTAVHEALGMSECSTYLSSAPARPAPDGTAGFVQAGRRIAILDDAGAPVPRGTAGVIGIDRRDPGLMIGYLGDPAATAARYVNDWFVTGDRAVMREDGAIAFQGRSDDLMNAGGLRVAPQEIEAALSDVAGITDLAVAEVAVRDGVTVIGCAFCGGDGLTDAALRQRAETVLAPWKRPRLYHRVDHLPRNANAKLDRRALAGLFPRETP